MMITRKIWVIEADNDECCSEPIIKYSAVEAEDYVRKEYEDICTSMNRKYICEWEIENGTGTASIYDFYGYGDYYNWRITEHEIEFEIDAAESN